MDHEWNGSGHVSEIKWDVRQDDKWNEKGMKVVKGKIEKIIDEIWQWDEVKLQNKTEWGEMIWWICRI